MFEQFVNSGAKFLYNLDSLYFYKLDNNVMCAQFDVSFPYKHEAIEQLIHSDMVKITRLIFS